MIRRVVIPLVLVFLVACGASQRERALRATFTATQAAQAGFLTWDHDHKRELLRAATSEADGVTKLDAYSAQREPVLAAFEATYRTIASAALVDTSDRSLADTLAALEQLRRAIKLVTGKDLP